MSEPSGPLADITIIDCTMALAGPFGAAILADLGANVIKVEPPVGDMARSVPPLPEDYANAGSAEPAGCDFGGYFASVNRNKRSVVVDLKTEAGRETLLALCGKADAIIENMRAGVMDRLGLGYEVLRGRNPALVYGCIRGFGDPRTGESPYADWPAYDIVAQSMGGIAHITGPESSHGFPAGASIGDLYPGTLLALGVVAAVHHARRTGEGQFMDVGMYDAVMFLSETVVANYGYGGTELGPRGAHHPNLCPFGIFPAADGAVAIAAPGPGHWQALCEAIGRPDLVDDEKTRNTFVRRKHQHFVEGVISDWTSARSKAEVVAALGGRVPCGPVNTAADMFGDPHVAARGMISQLELPGANGKVSIVGTPIKYTGTPTGLYRRPPMLGEHTEEVLSEMGLAGAANDE
ncbi:MAG: CoA transferase [Pseudomonadales bacterium]|nr:CoA transferase [Pseudomonadales bacterium]NIX07371.1 CoA transferase [Pseudomonadales bacterium]